jgi:cell division septum initiation protein DivIVA
MPERDLAQASVRVQGILAAAEQAGEEMRLQAERRMQARIDEGARAADQRVQAAEAEALEVLAAAQEEAGRMVEQARAEAGALRDAAREQAREIVAEASAVAREVLRDGTEMSGHLRELSDSLRTNSELLLRDVRLAHAEMTARLDQAGVAPAPRTDPGRDVDTLDVPEFHPGRR